MLSQEEYAEATVQLAEVVDAFDEEYGTDTPMPDLEVQEYGRPHVGGEYAVEMGEYWARNMDADFPAAMVKHAIERFYETGLWMVVEEQSAELRDRYDHLDPWVAVDEVEFTDLRDEDGNGCDGSFDSDRRAIKLDDGLMPGIDPVRRGLSEDRSYGSVGRRVKQVTIHEAAHALMYAKNPHTETLSDHVSVTTEDHDAYTDDVRRTSLEAISRFEQYREHPNGRDKIYRSLLEDPWQVPRLFHDHVRKRPEDDHLFDDPYKLGHFAAHAIDIGFQEEYGPEKGRELAREYLLTCVTSPTGLEGAVERSFELRGLSYYPRLVDSIYDTLKRVDEDTDFVFHDVPEYRERPEICNILDSHDDLEAAMTTAVNEIDAGLAAATTTEEHVHRFHEGKALLQAYREVEPPSTWPEPVQELDKLLDRVYWAQEHQ